MKPAGLGKAGASETTETPTVGAWEAAFRAWFSGELAEGSVDRCWQSIAEHAHTRAASPPNAERNSDSIPLHTKDLAPLVALEREYVTYAVMLADCTNELPAVIDKMGGN